LFSFCFICRRCCFNFGHCAHIQVITRLSVGHAFTLALASSGELYGWGRNDAGQLGLGGGLSMDVYAMENLPRQVRCELFTWMLIRAICLSEADSAVCSITVASV
jgi:alpha-tubulin suppressor-like RCC1 family protein